MALEDLTDKKFGRLIVIEFAYSKKHSRYWRCTCECGAEKYTTTFNLKSGLTKSCGCLQKERTSEAAKKSNIKHGLEKHKLYHVWCRMKKCCYNEKCESYKNYGARGIKICDEWLDVVNFYNWAINNGYKEGLTIERINNNGNYEPENCKWITKLEQQYNTRRNYLITYNNLTKTMTEWAKEFNLKFKVLHDRVSKLKWDIDKAFNTPVRKQRKKCK